MENKLIKMENLKQKLLELKACNEAIAWSEGKTINEVWETCPRGDWMLWLFSRTNPDDIRLLTLAKGHCANTVRHLMEDQRSIDAVDAAIKFGNGEILIDELNVFAKESYSAYVIASYASYAAAHAADAAHAALAIFDASTATASASAAASDGFIRAIDNAKPNGGNGSAYWLAIYDIEAAAAKKANQLLTADICRKYLPCPTI